MFLRFFRYVADIFLRICLKTWILQSHQWQESKNIAAHWPVRTQPLLPSPGRARWSRSRGSPARRAQSDRQRRPGSSSTAGALTSSLVLMGSFEPLPKEAKMKNKHRIFISTRVCISRLRLYVENRNNLDVFEHKRFGYTIVHWELYWLREARIKWKSRQRYMTE